MTHKPRWTACEGGGVPAWGSLADHVHLIEAEAEARAPLEAEIARLRSTVDECRRMADPGVESDAPTDSRGQRLNMIWKATRTALAEADRSE